MRETERQTETDREKREGKGMQKTSPKSHKPDLLFLGLS